MDHSQYKRPPITEAVIEMRFSSVIEEPTLLKVSKKFEKNYSRLEPIKSHGLETNVINGESITNIITKTDYRLSSQDISQILILRQSAFVLSQLAPYKSWDYLISRFERDVKLHLKHAGYCPITRIGVRYINRIDIPKTGSLIHEAEYLNIYPKHPDILNPLLSYSINSRSELEDIKSLLTINSAVVNSPLPENISIVVDQDIVRETDLPQNTKDIIDFLHEVRIKKNSVFESCITDKTRELFDK